MRRAKVFFQTRTCVCRSSKDSRILMQVQHTFVTWKYLKPSVGFSRNTSPHLGELRCRKRVERSAIRPTPPTYSVHCSQFCRVREAFLSDGHCSHKTPKPTHHRFGGQDCPTKDGRTGLSRAGRTYLAPNTATVWSTGAIRHVGKRAPTRRGRRGRTRRNYPRCG
jgi:hypothetical protein